MIEGKVRILGRDINTDMITNGKHFYGAAFADKLRYTLYDYDPNFGVEYTPGEILVTGENFGCGSAREIAAIVFKELGVPAILSESFARTFFRNAINIGLPIFETPDVTKMFNNGDVAQIDPQKGILTNLTTNVSISFLPIPEEIQRIIDLGGLLPYVVEQLSNE